MVTDRGFFGADGFISHDLLHLSAVRNCQMVKMRDPQNPESDFVFVNTHLHHPVEAEDDYVRGL